MTNIVLDGFKWAFFGGIQSNREIRGRLVIVNIDTMLIIDRIPKKCNSKPANSKPR